MLSLFYFQLNTGLYDLQIIASLLLFTFHTASQPFWNRGSILKYVMFGFLLSEIKITRIIKARWKRVKLKGSSGFLFCRKLDEGCAQKLDDFYHDIYRHPVQNMLGNALWIKSHFLLLSVCSCVIHVIMCIYYCPRAAHGAGFSGCRRLTHASCAQQLAWSASPCPMSSAATHGRIQLAVKSAGGGVGETWSLILCDSDWK